MDTNQFDRITRRPTTGTSRRSAVGSLLAGVSALLIGADSLNAKPGGNEKSKGHGQEKSTGKKPEKTTGNGKAKNTAKAKGKVWLCHKPITPTMNSVTGLLDANRLQGVVIQVAASAEGGLNRRNKLRGHLRHGDFPCVADPALATLEQSQAFVKGSPCILENQLITNALGIQETTRRVTCPTTAPLTTTTDPVSSSS